MTLSGQNIRFTVQRGNQTILTQTVMTGADGSATLTYVGPADPSGADDAAVIDNVTAFWDKDRDNVDDGAAEFDDSGTVTWDDLLAPGYDRLSQPEFLDAICSASSLRSRSPSATSSVSRSPTPT